MNSLYCATVVNQHVQSSKIQTGFMGRDAVESGTQI